MKKTAFVFVAMILGAAAQAASDTKQAALSDEAAIRAARDVSNRAIAVHDLDGTASVWLPEYSSVTSNNVQSSGRDAARARFAQNFAARPDLVYVRTPDTVTVNTAWGHAGENGHWTGQWTQADGVTKIGGIYFAKWKKAGGRWLLLSETFLQTSCEGASYCAAVP